MLRRTSQDRQAKVRRSSHGTTIRLTRPAFTLSVHLRAPPVLCVSEAFPQACIRFACPRLCAGPERPHELHADGGASRCLLIQIGTTRTSAALMRMDVSEARIPAISGVLIPVCERFRKRLPHPIDFSC